MSARKAPRTPSYRLHKPTGQAFVEIEGKRHYLGAHGTPASIQSYARAIAECEANAYRLPIAKDELLVCELVDRFLEDCDVYCVDRAGGPTSTIFEMSLITASMLEPYSDVPVQEFGPLALRTVRQSWLNADLTITVKIHSSRDTWDSAVVVILYRMQRHSLQR